MLKGADAELEAPVLTGAELGSTTTTSDEEAPVLKAAGAELAPVPTID